jgi:large conductance mechanosensitive channel
VEAGTHATTVSGLGGGSDAESLGGESDERGRRPREEGGQALSIAKDFKAFLVKQNALALAIGVVIGAAVGKVVSALVDDIIMPVVGLLIPGGEWRSWEVGLAHDPAGKVTSAIKYGDLLGRIVDFAIIALVVFLITKALLRENTKPCPRCTEPNAAIATRCKFCTSDI